MEVRDNGGSPIVMDDATQILATFTSYLTASPNNQFSTYAPGQVGLTDPGALNIELDIPVVSEEIPSGQGYLKIWGLPLGAINNASALNFKNITIYAGFQNGLPLANAQNVAGSPRNDIIFKGSIYQAFGNWQGGEQTIEMFLGPQLFSGKKPGDPILITLSNDATFDYASSITNALTAAGYAVDGTPIIDSSLTKMPFQWKGGYTSLSSFASMLNETSKATVVKPNYTGIKIIRLQPNATAKTPVLRITDTPSQLNPVQINFVDLIGQPTWIGFNVLQFKLMMRSDISVGKYVSMPTTREAQTANSQSQFKPNIHFTKIAYVNSVRHVGNFRQETGDSWITIIDVIPNQA